MVLMDLHPSNESLRIFKPAGKVISLSDVQSSKATQPISVTLAGIMILSRDLHRRNVPYLITSIPSGIVIWVSDSQPEKALSPIDFTLLGIMILVSDLQP